MSMEGSARTVSGWPAVDVLLVVAVLIAIWQGLYYFVGEIAITSPVQTVAFASKLIGTPLFWEHCSATIRAFLFSLAIASIVGCLIGLALGFHRFSGNVAEPLVTALYTIPKVTLYPVILLIFGLGLSAKVAFGAMHGILPVILFTIGAVKSINSVHLKLARVLGLTPLQTAWTILMPAVAPEIVTGLRLGFSLSLLGVLIGEMFASQRGLGFLVMNGMHVHDVPLMMAVILLLVVFALVANSALLAFDRWLHRRA